MDVCGVVYTVYIPATTATAEVVYSTPDSLAQQFFFDFIKIHSNDTLIYLRIIFVIAAAGNSLKAFKQ